MSPDKVNTRFLIVICSIAAMCQFAAGFEIGRTNSYYNSHSSLETTLFITSLLLGLSVGSYCVKFLSKRFGRRRLMIISAMLLLCGTALNIIDGLITTVIARAIDGIACGIGSTVAPIYINEIATSEFSGKFGALNQICMTLGLCTISVFQLISLTETALIWWQISYIIFIGMVIIHICCLIFLVPDSPHSCIERGDLSHAKATLRRLMNNPGHVIDELEVTRNFVRIDPESYSGIKIALLCAFALSTCGYDYAVSYSIMLWINNDKFTAIVLGCSLLFSTVILNFLVLCFSERMHRKPVFVIGLCAIGMINFIHGFVKAIGADSDESHIVLVFLFFCAFQSTVGPFYWIYLPEVLKMKEISYPMSLMWGIQCVTAVAFAYKKKPEADTVYYFVFSYFSFVSALLISRYAIETKGRPWTVIVPMLNE
mmetsp:Transcript_9234/g.17568  ORF Transcript_9234/g.17568 Transcript_9234/m.17568 type:complete len:427 (+) Transcript_9234:305-1585(+)